MLFQVPRSSLRSDCGKRLGFAALEGEWEAFVGVDGCRESDPELAFGCDEE